jgi:methionine aminopeptidase
MLANLYIRHTISCHPFRRYLCLFSLSPHASHGIPDVRPLIAGDIVSIDISCFVDGVHGDCCGTFIVEPSGAGSNASGNAGSGSGSGGGSVTTVPRETRQLVEFARAVTAEAVALCAPGVPLQHIGAFIQVCNASSEMMSSIRAPPFSMANQWNKVCVSTTNTNKFWDYFQKICEENSVAQQYVFSPSDFDHI